ncbi:MAG: diguanylate cyclase, partial [Oscillospiraceae bacterium]
TDNPTAMKKAMSQLQNYGFRIMMDDFGSGYSSLSLLKDIAIDILKIDMQFLSQADIPGRGENILASVIRMAKWLDIPVIAEGAETAEQVNFLRSVGCDYVQGFYFARPMPIPDYEQLCLNLSLDSQNAIDKKYNNYRYDNLFSVNQDMKLLFGNSLQAAVIYEFVDDRIEMVRVNEAYYALLGHDDMLVKEPDILDLVDEEYREFLLKAFRTCTKTKENTECEYMRHRKSKAPLWIYTKLRYVSMVGNKHILIGELTDITMRKEFDFALQEYKISLQANDHDRQTILIVDDGAINRTVLKKILQNKFLFLEAENGKEAIRILQDHPNEIDLILLDIGMPVMNGKEFLQYKKKELELDGIPVIIITADDSTEQQISTFSLGANDYIVKPFIPEVVTRRVSNVLESCHRFKKMVREYNDLSEQVKTDLMTGLLNRVSAEETIVQYLEKASDPCAMVMLDIDNFKKINDTYGHNYGDKVICAVAENLRLFFRKEDIIARMGGDEFAVFIGNISHIALVENKARQFCASMSQIRIGDKDVEITCSAGIAMSSKIANSFETLYQNSDKALYNAKCLGRNILCVYGENSEITSISKWITNAESVLNALSDSVYACDRNTYELIYANDNLCKLMGVTQEICKSKKCYEVLMHRTKPCKGCSMHKMVDDKVY